MNRKERIIEISDDILTQLLEFRKKNPQFTFSLRQRDSAQSKEVRLANGQWFQGSDYIYVPLFKKGDNARKIKTLGFVITLGEDGSMGANYIEISFRKGSENENEQRFHRELAEKLNLEINDQNFGRRNYKDPNEYKENLDNFLQEVLPLALELINKYALQKYIVSEKEFQENLNKIFAIKKYLNQDTNSMFSTELDKYIKILLHKKQIILQGPPGTGKTYTAKKIAESLTGYPLQSINKEMMKNCLKLEATLANASGKTDFYTVTKIDNIGITLQSKNSQPWVAKYDKIIEKYKQFESNEKPTNVNGTDPYEIAVAKFLFENRNRDKPYTIVQFHPSYTYEDFVRGISAKNEGHGISYETENKVLAELALEANNNLITSSKDVEDYSKEEGIKDLMIEFSETVQDKIDEFEEFKITEAVSIVAVETDAFRYTGKWKTSQRMKYKDLVTAILHNVSSRQDFKKLDNVSGLARQHSTYFFKVLEQFKNDFSSQLKDANNKTFTKPKLKNYVLIIDEINRANLPSVLGELIYALEYRGENVNSMYAIDGETAITIPKNLYIIGTMNTADRSVGHIDYAIKRRFAFVDMLPTIEVITNNNARILFSLVSELFSETYLASDFVAKDVQLGHSYFLLDEKSELSESEQLQLKLDYEILPILNEYVKDGLLLETAKDKIKEIAEFAC